MDTLQHSSFKSELPIYCPNVQPFWKYNWPLVCRLRRQHHLNIDKYVKEMPCIRLLVKLSSPFRANPIIHTLLPSHSSTAATLNNSLYGQYCWFSAIACRWGRSICVVLVNERVVTGWMVVFRWFLSRSAFWQWSMTAPTLVEFKLYARVQIIVYLKQQQQQQRKISLRNTRLFLAVLTLPPTNNCKNYGSAQVPLMLMELLCCLGRILLPQSLSLEDR